MTIAAGFQVNDGFVFCSDTEGTTATLKLFRKKVVAPTVGACHYIYTGSGDAGFLQMAAAKIEQKLQERHVESEKEFAEVVEEVILSIHEKNIAAYPDDPKPSFSMIIGLLLNGKMSMIRTNATSVTVGSYGAECVGSGSTLGRFILNKLWCADPDIVHATIQAIYMLQQAREFAPGCGGISHIFCLRKDGSFGVVSQGEIKAWEEFFRHAEGVAQSFILVYRRGHIFGEGSFEKAVRKLLKESKKLPEPYKEFPL
ncbi:MAG: hypothetical protein ACRD4S_13425 [Candidatus Acidiferrales bacterium]